jgi:hypothetical protein
MSDLRIQFCEILGVSCFGGEKNPTIPLKAGLNFAQKSDFIELTMEQKSDLFPT